MRFRREYPELMDKMRPLLRSTRLALGLVMEGSVAAEDIGLKVWLLPPWYARERDDDASIRIAFADALAFHLNKPRVVCAGELRAAGVPATGRSWAIGKGLIGAATHDDSAAEEFHTVIHDAELERLASKRRREYRRLGTAKTLRRSQRDIRALCGTYGTAIGVGVRDAVGSTPFGCITLDVGTGISISDAQREACAEVLIATVPEIVQTISDWGKYSID